MDYSKKRRFKKPSNRDIKAEKLVENDKGKTPMLTCFPSHKKQHMYRNMQKTTNKVTVYMCTYYSYFRLILIFNLILCNITKREA